jgi:hypothetical protein
MYGQHALCLSLPPASIEEVARVLLVARPTVYGHSLLPPALAAQYPVAARLLPPPRLPASGGEGWQPGADVGRAADGGRAADACILAGWNGSRWFHAAKSPDLRLPFHEAVLEPMLGAGMAWQTWRRGARALASQCTCPAHAAAAADAGARCSRFASMNVHRVWLRYGTQEEPQASRGWLGYDDHSKWGVTWGTKPQAFSTTSGGAASCWPKWSGALQGAVCIADVNRDASQIRRGGGAVCSRDPALVRTLRRLVASVDRCCAPTAPTPIVSAARWRSYL